MDQIVFKKKTKSLIDRCENIKKYDFEEVDSIINAFKKLSISNQKCLNNYTLEHIDHIELDFENSRNYKKKEKPLLDGWNQEFS